MTETLPPADAGTPEKKRVTVRSILLLIVIFIVIPYVGLGLLWRGRCKKAVLATSLSPDGKIRVEQVTTDCGATMPVASEINLQATTPATPGDANEAKTVLLLPANKPLPITWESLQSLIIDLPPMAQIAKHENEWHGVKITLRGERAPPKFTLPTD